MKRWMIMFCTFVMILTGCANNSEYARSSAKGELKESNLEEIYTKFDQKDDFVLLITFSFCGHCQDLKAVLVPYLENHKVVVYELVMDKLTPNNADYEVAKDKLNTYLKDYEGTPSFYYIEDGKKKDEIIGFSKPEDGKDAMTPYDDLFQKYQIDAE